MYSWYENHLGIQRESFGPAFFHWRDAEKPEQRGLTVWSIFPSNSPYFDRQSMINYCVADLDQLLIALAAEGVSIDPKRENTEYGKFAWIFDPEGNRIELWEPPAQS